MRRAVALCAVMSVLGGCAGGAPEARPDDPAEPQALQPFAGITVRPAISAVEIEAWSCLEAGWLEQIACAPGTREHEALAVIKAKPSDVHAALLLAGFQPGAPGSWSYENESLSFTPPTGDRLDIVVRYERTGQTIEEPIRAWMVDARGRPSFPDAAWVFAGSLFVANPDWMGPGEHYVADQTGSIIGLVTFGDEVVGFEEVFADQQSVQPLAWQVRIDHVPPLGTPLTLILRRAAPSP